MQSIGYSIVLEYIVPVGPFGARGMGEMHFIPLAPAIESAVHQVTDIWFREFPLTPEPAFWGLGKI